MLQPPDYVDRIEREAQATLAELVRLYEVEDEIRAAA